MPKLIVSSRYLKSGSGNRKQLYHYVKYIATREGSVGIPIKKENAPASEKQQELISSLLSDFPESRELLEYEDYIKNPTVKTASQLISAVLDHNMDRLTDRKNYVGYLANRPGTVKFGSHGLFSQEDAPINLDRTAKEISEHGGNVWTHIVSLRRDHAQQMGYDNLGAWRELVKRQISSIAKNQKISLENLKWYAAFHDKESNSHVHIIVYSIDTKEGFLTNQGIEKIRSGFANDIYHDELYHLYDQQNVLRSELKAESKKLMEQLAKDIAESGFSDTELLKLIQTLDSQLQDCKGKKVYGYLPPAVKKTVDEIFSRLAGNDSVQKMYGHWCELEQQKHDTYSSAKVQFPVITENKHFKNERYIGERGSFLLGRLYLYGIKDIQQDREKAAEWLTLSAEQGNPYAKNLLNHMHDFENAVMANIVLGLFVNLSRCIADDYNQRFHSNRMSADRKLRRIIREKKMAMGIKENQLDEKWYQ